jgi:hypothetical protein
MDTLRLPVSKKIRGFLLHVRRDLQLWFVVIFVLEHFARNEGFAKHWSDLGGGASRRGGGGVLRRVVDGEVAVRQGEGGWCGVCPTQRTPPLPRPRRPRRPSPLSFC